MTVGEFIEMLENIGNPHAELMARTPARAAYDANTSNYEVVTGILYDEQQVVIQTDDIS
jgi:hypothetical protein